MLSEGQERKRSSGSESSTVVPAAISDTGCERDLNEDRYAVIDSPSGIAWVVCDGMGGVSGGELAAQLAIDAMRRDLENQPERAPEPALRSAMLEANRVIVLRRQNQTFGEMGTTIVAALFNGAEVVVAHVGDSRAYLIRGEAIQALTVDHTLVQELVDKGQIDPEEAMTHPQAHVLTRCLGAEPGVQISLNRYWVWEAESSDPTDYLFLCSDGLYSLVSDVEIAEAVVRAGPQGACVDLVELAKSRGGYDNITIAIVPIAGQLKNEAPRVALAARNSKDSGNDPRAKGVGLTRTMMTIVALSLLTALLAMVVFVFLFLSK